MMEWEDKFKSNLLEVLYRADQPRDEKGRWTSGGASAGSVEDSKVYNWALNKFGDAQTAKNFTEWFGDSKVVDADGNPMVVYHGTTADFDEFQRTMDVGPHFGTAEQAGVAAGVHEGDPKIMPVYLKMENPLRVTDEQANQPSLLQDELIKRGLVPPDMKDIGFEPAGNIRIRNQLEGMGYDGLVYENTAEGPGDSYIVFNPTQIKSATGNVGTFDPNNPNITLSDEE